MVKQTINGVELEIGPGANLYRADLSGANLSRANLYRADLPRANLYRADLSGATLSGANLYRADLYMANLYRANLFMATLYMANLYRANLLGANLSGANLYRANLLGANLSGADLSRANLSGANLSGATLSGANLSGADLSGANLSGANLSGANLSGANLSGADLDDGALDRFSIIPDGQLVVYKGVAADGGPAVIALEIPADAQRTHKVGDRKCRFSAARVIGVVAGNETGPWRSPTYPHKAIEYVAGELYEVADFDDDPLVDCAPGVHAFLTVVEAAEWVGLELDK